MPLTALTPLHSPIPEKSTQAPPSKTGCRQDAGATTGGRKKRRSGDRRSQKALREAFFDFYVDAEGAVVVAEGDDGRSAVDVVLDLDNLLLGGADVADVGDGEVASDLLFDGDAGGGVLFGAAGGKFGKARADANAGNAEEAFEASTQLAGDSFGEQLGSAGAGPERAGGGAAAARGSFVAGLADGEERDDVIAGQRRIGAIGKREFVGGAAEIESDFVLLNGGGGFEIDFGVQLERIGKVQIAALHAITAAVKIEVAREHVNVAEQNRMLPGAARAEVGVGFELRVGPFHAGIGSGDGFHIELQIAQEIGTGGRARGALAAA